MTTTGLDILDNAIGEANRWIQEILEDLGQTNRHLAYNALRSVLHSIRDFLPFEDAMQFAGQLPPVVRSSYLEGWRPVEPHPKEASRQEFLVSVAERILEIPELTPDRATQAVFGLLSRRIDQGAMTDLREDWPEPLREFWPRAQALAPPHLAPSDEGQRALVNQTIREIEALIERARQKGVPEDQLPVLLPPARPGSRPQEQEEPIE